MSITVGDDAGILDSNIRIKFLRDAEYSAAPPLVAFYNDKQVLLQTDPQGRLQVSATVVPSSDFIVQGIDGSGTPQNVHGGLDPITGNFALYTQDPRFAFVSNALRVIVDNTPSASTALNKYGSVSVAPNTPTVIATYTVPTGKTLDVDAFVVWGDVDAAWTLSVDGTPVGGTRTSPSKLSDSIAYTVSIPVAAGSTVQVQATHYASSSQLLYANLEGNIN